MNTIPTALLVIAGLSTLPLIVALAFIWALSPDKDYPAERYGKIGLSRTEQFRLVAVVWL